MAQRFSGLTLWKTCTSRDPYWAPHIYNFHFNSLLASLKKCWRQWVEWGVENKTKRKEVLLSWSEVQRWSDKFILTMKGKETRSHPGGRRWNVLWIRTLNVQNQNDVSQIRIRRKRNGEIECIHEEERWEMVEFLENTNRCIFTRKNVGVGVVSLVTGVWVWQAGMWILSPHSCVNQDKWLTRSECWFPHP